MRLNRKRGQSDMAASGAPPSRALPAPGLPIRIQPTYDSLLRSQSGDFGYGWNLGIKMDVQTSPTNNVTLTIHGKRRTFYFTPAGSGK